MALTPSHSIALGSPAFDFELLDTQSNTLKNLETLKGDKGTVILFICNHCPFVIHINSTLVALANTYQAKGINFIAISSNNAIAYPQDGPDMMTKLAQQEGYPFPYLYDETQEIARAYGATCTPDIYLYDEGLQLAYHGQLDDSRPGNNKECDGADLSNAMENLLANKPTENQRPSIGCSIKWK